MTDGSERLPGRERTGLAIVLGAVVLLVLGDAATDWASGGSPRHLALELTVAALATLGFGQLWVSYVRERSRVSEAHRSLERARAEAEHWRLRHRDVLCGLSAAIDHQLDAWHLSPAEKEVAFLLLKGLSFKEIADVRRASERTVRQQALSVYAKGGLAGRAELAAFFLEDLLVPAAPAAGTPSPA